MKKIQKSNINLACYACWVIVFTWLTFGFQVSRVEAQGVKINNATLKPSGNIKIVVKDGDLINNGIYATASETFTFTGTQAVVVSGTASTTFANLTLNNEAGLTLENDVSISGILEFVNGKVSTGDHLMTMGPVGTFSNTSSTGYIEGKLAHSFSAPCAKHFPIGKEGAYRPLTLKFSALTGTSVVEAEQFETPLTGDLPENTTLMTTGRHWKLSQTGASEMAYSITLDPTDYTPARPVVMLKQDNGFIISAATTNPTYTNVSAFTGFSEFGLGEECMNPDDGGLIAGEQNSCNSFNPEEIKNEELPSGHIGVLDYQWQMSETGADADFEDILGANDDSFSPGTVTQTTWYRRLARVDCDEDWDEAAASNVVKITIYETLSITCPTDLSVNNEPSLCSASVPFAATSGGTPTPTLTYMLDGEPITSPHVFEVGTHTVVATAANVCGVVTCGFTVKVNDTEKPNVSCQNITIDLDASGNATITPDDINDGSTDNCGIATMTLSRTEFDCSDMGGAIPVTLSVTDVNGNTASCTATVTVNELSVPMVRVNITASKAPNGQVLFKATPVNGGDNPTYKWYKNGDEVKGATGDELISTCKSGDEHWVELTSSIPCTAVATSNAMCTY